MPGKPPDLKEPGRATAEIEQMSALTHGQASLQHLPVSMPDERGLVRHRAAASVDMPRQAGVRRVNT